MKKYNLKNLTIWLFAMFFSLSSFGQVIIGTGTSTSSTLPMEPYYDYSYSQSIYLASEIGGPGTIQTIAYKYDGSTQLASSNDIVIYIGHTTKNSFSSSYDWIATTAMTQVYNGTLPTFTTGSDVWLTFDITDYAYNGTDNLVIAFDENTPGYQSSGDFYSSSVSGDRSIVFYRDATDVNPASPPSSGTYSYMVSEIPYLTLVFAPIVPDYALNNIDIPSEVCGQSFIDVTLEYTNTGISIGDTLNFTYVEQSLSTVVNEQIIVNITQGVTDYYTFTTPYAINPNIDSNYCFTAWLTMDANGDPVANNDSIMSPVCIHNGILLPVFTTYGDTVPYATTATLIADTVDTGLEVVKWFTDSTSLTEIFVGDSLVTPILQSTTTFWAEGSMSSASCPTTRIPVTAVVNNFPLVDAGIVEIVNPIVGFNNSIAQDIEVVIKNFTTAPLLAANIIWELNGVQTTYPYTNMGGLAQGELDTVVVNNQLIPTIVNNFVAYTSMPNSIADTYNLNDTLKYNTNSCFKGTVTIGSTPGNDFVTINEAITALENSELCGHTTFLLDAETFNENIVLNPFVGSGPNAILTFKGHGDLTKITAAGTSTDYTIFSIRGADYINIDSIFIEGTGSYAYGIHMTDTAEHINIVNSHIKVPYSTGSNINAITTGSVIYCISNGLHVNNLIISNNIIEGGYTGINISGSSSSHLSNISINNNKISDCYYYGLYTYYTDTVEIHNNEITKNESGSFYGMYTKYCNYTNITYNNIIGGGTSYHYGIFMSYCNQASSLFRGQIANNTIMFNGTSTGSIYAICNNNSYNIDIVNNTVSIGPNYTSAYSRCLYSTYSQKTRIINNNFVNLSNYGHAMYLNSIDTTYVTQCDYNNYYCPNSSKFIYYGGEIATLTAMQIASSHDGNSLNVDPNLASNIDAHIMSADLDSAATPWSSVVYDMDMEMRDATNPDIGADEFTYRTKDLVANTIINPISPIVIGQNIYPTVEVQSMGADTVFSYDISYQIDGGAVITESNTTTLAFSYTENYTFTTNGVYAPATDFLLTVWVSNVIGDADLSNDTIYTMVTVPNDDAGIVSTVIPTATPHLICEMIYPSIDFKNFGVNTITTCDISYKFNDGMMVTETYNGSLALNQNTTFTFATAYPLTATTTDVVIYTSLVGDVVTSNDTSKVSFVVNVPAHDAGVSNILYPNNSVFVSGQIIVPQVEVTNYGLNAEISIDISCVSGMNTITETWTGNLAPGASFNYNFTQGFVFDHAYPNIKAYTTLTNDVNWNNDTTIKTAFYTVTGLDVALTAITDPAVNTYTGQNVYPTVTIFNEGSITQNSIDVTYVFNGGTPVTETWTGAVTYQTSTTFTFNTPFVAPTGTYSLCVYTQLSNDALLSNDTACTSITSIAPTIDVGVSAIATPAASSPMCQEVFPCVTLENFATTAQTSFDVTYVMGNNAPVTETWTGNLAAGATTTYTFTQSFITPLIDFDLCVYTELTTDQATSNDTTRMLVITTTALEDVGISAIINPTTLVYVGQIIIPTVTIENFGVNTQTSLDITYIVNGVSVTETWTGSLAAGATDNYTFTQGIVIDGTNIDICAHTNCSLDLIHSNDTIYMATIMPMTPTIDVGISSIASPNSTDIATYYNTASVWIYNYGTSVQSSIPITYQIDALSPIQETWTGNLPSGDSVLFTFTNIFESTVDYQFCAVTNLSSDQVIENNGNCQSVVIGIGETIAQDISLEQNIPNPATNNTLINFNVPNNGTAVLAIRDLQGRLIYTEKSNVLAGSNSFFINTENYASGLYLYTLNFNGVSLSKKMSIQK